MIRTRRAFATAMWIGAGLLLAHRAGADPVSLRLTWDAPPECPTSDDVKRDVQHITRVRPDRPPPMLQVEGLVTVGQGRYRLLLLTLRDGQSGSKQIEAQSCASLSGAAALVIALAYGDGVEVVDGDAATAEAEPPLLPRKEGAPVPSPTDSGEPKASAPPSTLWSAWASGAASSGLLATTGFGARLGAWLGNSDWRATAHGTYWPAHTADTQGFVASFEAVTTEVGLCRRVTTAALFACASVEAGAIRGWSIGTTHDGQATAPWFAMAPSIVLAVPLGIELDLRVEAELAISLGRPRFSIAGRDDIYSVGQFVPMGALGLAYNPRH